MTEAKKKQREDFAALMQQMPELVFGGSLIFVKTPEDDERAYEELIHSSVIGVDFEWTPDFNAESNNPLSLAQVCDGHRCYIWLLFRFRAPPRRLHELLLNPKILKVGCGMRGSDLAKLDRTGLRVGTPIVRWEVKGDVPVEKLSFPLPSDFEDVQDFKLGARRDQPLPFTGLNHLLGFFLKHRPPNLLKPEKAVWRRIEQDTRLQEYAVTDAYAVLLIWYQYHGGFDTTSNFFERDDQFIERMLLGAGLVSQAELASLSNASPVLSSPPPPMTFPTISPLVFSSTSSPLPPTVFPTISPPVFSSPSSALPPMAFPTISPPVFSSYETPSSSSTGDDTEESEISSNYSPPLVPSHPSRAFIQSAKVILPIQVSLDCSTPRKLFLRRRYAIFLDRCFKAKQLVDRGPKKRPTYAANAPRPKAATEIPIQAPQPQPSGFHSSNAGYGPKGARAAPRDRNYAKNQNGPPAPPPGQGTSRSLGGPAYGESSAGQSFNGPPQQQRETAAQSFNGPPQQQRRPKNSELQPQARQPTRSQANPGAPTTGQGQQGAPMSRRQKKREQLAAAAAREAQLASSSSAPSAQPPATQHAPIRAGPAAPSIQETKPAAEVRKIVHSAVARIATAAQGKNRILTELEYKIIETVHPKGLAIPYFQCELACFQPAPSENGFRLFFGEGTSIRAAKKMAAEGACRVYLVPGKEGVA